MARSIFTPLFLSRARSCKQCEPCCRDDCSECVHCKDMPKFGGVGKMKQCCLTKQCIAPILPSTASCQVCAKKKGSRKLSQLKPEEILYECERCMEIHHLPCFHVSGPSHGDERRTPLSLLVESSRRNDQRGRLQRRHTRNLAVPEMHQCQHARTSSVQTTTHRSPHFSHHEQR